MPFFLPSNSGYRNIELYRCANPIACSFYPSREVVLPYRCWGLHRQFVIGERYVFIVESGGKLFSQSGKLVYCVTDKIVATIAPRYTEVLYCAHEIQESAREPAQSHVGAD